MTLKLISYFHFFYPPQVHFWQKPRQIITTLSPVVLLTDQTVLVHGGELAVFTFQTIRRMHPHMSSYLALLGESSATNLTYVWTYSLVHFVLVHFKTPAKKHENEMGIVNIGSILEFLHRTYRI
jgi:hypothetical protein